MNFSLGGQKKKFGLVSGGKSTNKILSSFAGVDTDDQSDDIGADSSSSDKQSNIKRGNRLIAAMTESIYGSGNTFSSNENPEHANETETQSYYENLLATTELDYHKQHKRSESKATKDISSEPEETYKSRYISGLLDTAKARDRVKEVIHEKKLLKEREAEDAIYGDTPQFVTSAYREKLKEREQWELEEKKAEREGVGSDVHHKGMASFYGNILNNKTQLLTSSGDIPSSSAYTVDGGTKPAHVSSSSGGGGGSRSIGKGGSSGAEPPLALAPHRGGGIDQQVSDSSSVTSTASHVAILADAVSQSAEREAAKVAKIAAARERYLQRKQQRDKKQ